MIIDASHETPEVIFDPENSRLKISGLSHPENAKTFYDPIIDIVSAFLKNEKNALNCEFYFKYINSASSKFLRDLAIVLEEFHKNGSKISIKWAYDEDDTDMMDQIDDIFDRLIVPYEKIEEEY